MFSFGLPDFQAPNKAPSSVPIDEDAQKRSTDCIYFLASPLTCKKGNNCEYRHSEAARTNPRDCRFWKSGNCLNAHCSFRHLPLEVQPGSAISSGSTMPQSVPAKAMAATAGSSKSKTPCYFFSQGYCAKSDKCTFSHGLPVASAPAEAPADQNSLSGMKGKTVHSIGRSLIVLKQNGGVVSEEARPVTIGSSEAVVEAHPLSSRAPASAQGIPKKVAVAAPFKHDKESEKIGQEPDRLCYVPNLVNGSRQGKVTTKTLQLHDNGQWLTKTGDLSINKKGFQSKALRKEVPAGGRLHQSLGMYSLLPGSGKSPQALRKVPSCGGQDSDDAYGDCKGQREELGGDLRSHLAKRVKINSSLYSSTGKGGNLGLASQQRGSGEERHHELPKQKKQQKGGNNRNVVIEAGFDAVKGVKLNKGASPYPPPKAPKQTFSKVPSRSLGGKQVVDDPKAARISDKRIHASPGITSKSSLSENVRDTLNFTGPKSLAQIKAEKMAATLKATGRLDSSSVMSESGSNLGNRTSAMSESGSNLGTRTSAVSADAVASNHELHRLSVATIKKDKDMKPEAAKPEGCEAQITSLSKRKRVLESGIYETQTMQGPTAGQVSALKSFIEMEDGEFCGDDSCNIDDLQDCTLVPSEEDFDEGMSPKDEVSGDSQSSSEEALEFEADSSEDGSQLDLEMDAGAVEDYEIDDDDEDDFAKKLARFFGLSNE